MTDEELEQEQKRIADALKRSDEWWKALSDEEKKRLQTEAENTRLWEDFTDVDITPQLDKKPSDH